MPLSTNSGEQRHNEDMQDIINAVPSWILRWGIVVFFGVLLLILSLSAFIRYPEIVKAKLFVSSPNLAKPVFSKIPARLERLLVRDGQTVHAGQPLAYLESTADHSQVLSMLTTLKALQQYYSKDQPPIAEAMLQKRQRYDRLGELQVAFQTFNEAYLTYNTVIGSGFLIRKKSYLLKDLGSLSGQAKQLISEKKLQQRDSALASEEYKIHKKLASQKIETPAELRQQESKYISRKAPLLQTEAALIAANSNFMAKQKEILELDNQVFEEKAKFLQALNSLISQTEDWKSKYVLTSVEKGKLNFAGNIQENQVLSTSSEVFYISTRNEKFFGEMNIPQDNMGKVRLGQEVLIKLRSYRFEEYGMLKGRIIYLSDVPNKDSVFLSRVNFETAQRFQQTNIRLKQGMVADAEVITEDATLLQRLTRNITRALNTP